MYNDWAYGKEKDVKMVYEDNTYRIYESSNLKNYEASYAYGERGWYDNEFSKAKEDGVMNFYYVQNVKKHGNIYWIYFNYGSIDKAKQARILFVASDASGDKWTYRYYPTRIYEREWKYKYSELEEYVFNGMPKKILYSLPLVIDLMLDKDKVNNYNNNIVPELVANNIIEGDTFFWQEESESYYDMLFHVLDESHINKIKIGKNIKGLQEGLFKLNDRIKSITFEEGSNCKRIEKDAFLDCLSLRQIVIPKSVQYIGKYAFEGCKLLENVIFEEGSNCERIDTGAFSNCKSLKNIIIPKNIQGIKAYAIKECDHLEFESMSNIKKLGSWYDYDMKYHGIYDRPLRTLTLPADANDLAILRAIRIYSYKSCLIIDGVPVGEVIPEIRIHGKYRPEIFKNVVVDPQVKVKWIDEGIEEKCGDYEILCD